MWGSSSWLHYVLWHAKYLIWNAGLDKAEALIKIARRNINNLRYADDTTLMAENEVELKSLLMKVKEEQEKSGLVRTQLSKSKILTSGPITSWQIDGETKETVTDFIFLDSKITASIKWKDICFLEEKLWAT